MDRAEAYTAKDLNSLSVPGIGLYNSRHEAVLPAGNWKQVIEATMFVTGAVVNVWTGTKPLSPDPTGTYTRLSGCDPTATLTIEALQPRSP